MTDQPALRIENLKFRYHKRRKSEPWVVDVPALELYRGEQMLLTGGSGRGKSTLLHLIAGLMEPVEGETFVDGTPIHSLHGAQRDLFRGKRIGMIFQSFNLLHGFSAQDNVMAAMMFSSIPRKEHKRRAQYLLKHLGIEHPRRDPDKMSIGQQQRIAVARAVACDPVLVLADEPTASLDPENAAVAIKLIQDICREQSAALLCVSHDPALVEKFPLRASLDDLALGRQPDRLVAPADERAPDAPAFETEPEVESALTPMAEPPPPPPPEAEPVVEPESELEPAEPSVPEPPAPVPGAPAGATAIPAPPMAPEPPQVKPWTPAEQPPSEDDIGASDPLGNEDTDAPSAEPAGQDVDEKGPLITPPGGASSESPATEFPIDEEFSLEGAGEPAGKHVVTADDRDDHEEEHEEASDVELDLEGEVIESDDESSLADVDPDAGATSSVRETDEEEPVESTEKRD